MTTTSILVHITDMVALVAAAVVWHKQTLLTAAHRCLPANSNSSTLLPTSQQGWVMCAHCCQYVARPRRGGHASSREPLSDVVQQTGPTHAGAPIAHLIMRRPILKAWRMQLHWLAVVGALPQEQGPGRGIFLPAGEGSHDAVTQGAAVDCLELG